MQFFKNDLFQLNLYEIEGFLQNVLRWKLSNW